MATLVLSQPGGLVAALAVACGAAAWLRMGRQAAPRRRAAWSGSAVLAGAAVGGALGAVEGAMAALALGGLAAVGGLWLATEWYGQREAGAPPRSARTLIGLRFCAWLLLLTLVARPTCERTVVTWEKPVLAVLLDESASMSLTDKTEQPGSPPSRAALVNAAVAEASGAVGRVGELYDVHLRQVGARPEPVSTWTITPKAPLTGLAAALRDAQEMRSTRGRPPLAVVLISDGAENVADAAAVRQVADDLARQHTALLAIGVGPEIDQTSVVELEPLALPPQVGERETLHVVAAGRVQSCRGQTLPIELLWDDEVVESAALGVESDSQRFERAFDVLPPGPGAHRATVRVTAPAVSGRQSFVTSAVVEVTAGRIQVLYLEQAPSTESAFAARALRGDASVDVTQRFLFDDDTLTDAGRDAAELWAGYDVVVLGHLRPPPSLKALDALAKAVTEHGLGLLLAGGADFFNSGEYARTPLAEISPVQLSERVRGRTEPRQFIPTAAGLQHPVVQGVSARGGGTDTQPAALMPSAEELSAWAQLPAIDGPVLDAPKPAAIVLAVDEAERPFLVAQQVGRGRCLAAGWENTWPWALVSDEGNALQRRLWRQMAVWLAQRRPRAWVVTDQPNYVLAALAGGGARIRIRGGITGLAGMPAARRGLLRATLTLERLDPVARSGESVAVKLKRAGSEWTAELPEVGSGAGVLPAGAYALAFEVRGVDDGAATPERTSTRPEDEILVARTRFVVVEENIESRAPTANLPLLQAAAERTVGSGGIYCGVAELPRVMSELASHDRRERSEARVHWDVADRDPWGLLVWLTVILGAEWVLRKRRGLA